MIREATAFAPSHVSGLFAIHDEAEDVLARGSRGAGWCLDQGAHATVRQADSTTIALDGTRADAPVTADALAGLTDEPLAVDIRLDLPTGQGFGMSAAGTLAACLAATHLLEIEPEDALKAAHAAEVVHQTGLGDAVGSWFGGGELRIKPGCPPAGWAMRIEPPEGIGFVFCVLGEPIHTASIIREPQWKARTKELGDAAVDRILDHGREGAWQKLVIESAVFSHRLGLMPERMARLGSELPGGLSWGQCMLGSTMWVVGRPGDLERAAAVLEGQGAVLRAGPDRGGARLVRRLAA